MKNQIETTMQQPEETAAIIARLRVNGIRPNTARVAAVASPILPKRRKAPAAGRFVERTAPQE